MDGGSRVLAVACGELAGRGVAGDAVAVCVQRGPVTRLADSDWRGSGRTGVGAISIDYGAAHGCCTAWVHKTLSASRDPIGGKQKCDAQASAKNRGRHDAQAADQTFGGHLAAQAAHAPRSAKAAPC